MKKNIIIVLVMIISSLTFSNTVFKFKDLLGDDSGPGSYIYPSNKVFRKGAFDLRNFKIIDNDDVYIFQFEIASEYKNEWKNDNGWDVQMFDVYLNFGEGVHKHTIAGRDTKIKQGWDKSIVISPLGNKKMWSKEIVLKNKDIYDDKDDSGDNLTRDIILPENFLIEKKILKAFVSKKKMPNLKKLKGIQVFLLGSEGYPSSENSYCRTVNEYRSEWRFGGGTDFKGDSNVIDILGDNASLRKFTATEEEYIFAEVDMVEVK